MNLVVWSIVATVLRYTAYLQALTSLNSYYESRLDASTSEALGDGRNYPPVQLSRADVPSPSKYYVPWLTIVPGQSAYPWVLLTATYVEETVVSFLVTGSVLLYGGRYCEMVWGSTEFARFIGILTVVPNAVAFLFYRVLYGITDQPEYAAVTICGGPAVVAGFLVAFKQLVPEHCVVLLGCIRFRVNSVPLAYLVVASLTGLWYDVYAVLAWLGFFASWYYLRFLRVSYIDPVLPFSTTTASLTPTVSLQGEEDSKRIRGDAADSFSLASFFPEPISLAIDLVCDACYQAACGMRLMRRFSEDEIETANARARERARPAGAAGYAAVGAGVFRRAPVVTPKSRAEAERRRFLALRALDRTTTFSTHSTLTPPPQTQTRPWRKKDPR
ncbi:hypothetical protein TRVA0_013S02080 [Trichomonascus vanleenenianus]|uniref:rhomboid family protein n=1 Tax=Trichomonascus vanleenenianus TaxID=2268995 RepID=UPI003ECA08B6